MAIDFPNTPTVGQTFSGPNGIIWQWDGVKWIAIPGTNPSIGAGNVGRNLLHNPLFNVWQRGGGPWTGGGYTADRWQQYIAGGDTCSTQIFGLADTDRNQIGDEAAQWMLGLTFTGTTSTASQVTLFQNIENVRRSAGKTVTLSFWARNVSGSARLGIAWSQNFGSGGSPSAPVVGNLGVTPLLTASFTRYTFTVALPSIIGKTVGSNSDNSLGIQFFPSCSTSNANNGNAGGIGAQSGSVNLWGIQLEIGTQATPLEKPDPRYDLSNCQRFYRTIGGVQVNGYAGGVGPATTTGVVWSTMRATPTVAVSGQSYVNGSGLVVSPVSPDAGQTYMTSAAVGSVACSFSLALSADL